MAEADPRGTGSGESGQKGAGGAEQVAVVTFKTRFALLASSVWRYSLAIPPLTHLPTYRSRYSATLHSPAYHLPLTARHCSHCRQKVLPTFKRSPWECTLRAPASPATWRIPQLLLHYTVDA